jgi:predicted nucleic acid-binding protein
MWKNYYLNEQKTNMAIKLFLDTNIILDILDTNRIFAEESALIFNNIETGFYTGYISKSVITTTDYILTKKFNHINRIALLKELLGLLKIIGCNNAIIQNAIQSNTHDIEDAILYQLALSEKVDYFITNDKQAQIKLTSKKLPIVSSKQFLKLLKK